ncbi:hypothetical protein FA15DRAFT_592401, partial [Coprinopsis marcescibilis]
SKFTLSAEIVSIDPISRTIIVDWDPSMDRALVNCTALLERPVLREIYIPQYIYQRPICERIASNNYLSSSLLDHTSPSWRQEAPYPPLFVYNSSDICPTFLWPQYASFRTVTKLFPGRLRSQDDGGFLTSSRMAYPSDRYFAPFEISVVNPVNSRVSAPTVSNLSSATLGYELSLASVIMKPASISGDERLLFTLNVSRSRSVKLFVYSTVATSWLVTISFLVMLAGAAVYNEHRIYAEMFVVPIGALFAFTSIRANLPGAPSGFGTVLDAFSIVPVLIIMSSSSFLLLMAVFFKRVRQLGNKEVDSVAGGGALRETNSCPTGCRDTLNGRRTCSAV